jgi:hypothetical protein
MRSANKLFSMKNFLPVFFLLFTVSGFASRIPYRAAADNDIARKSGFLFKAGYNYQAELHWIEAGIGRINILNFAKEEGEPSLSTGAAAFTFGGDFGFGDTSVISAVKLGFEAHLVVFGARLSYGYFMQDANSSGVITIEGGFSVFHHVYAYAGYNFVIHNRANPVIPEGARLALGINFPFLVRESDPPKTIGNVSGAYETISFKN